MVGIVFETKESKITRFLTFAKPLPLTFEATALKIRLITRIPDHAWLRPLLWLFSQWYGLITFGRNLAYEQGWLKSFSPDIPVVCIGNINAGGSGKTPHTELIAAYLYEVLGPVAILSRGYGRHTKGFHRAVPGDTPAILGDEAHMLHAKLPFIPLAVCEDRWHGLQQLKVLHPELKAVVMDDGFQHRRVRPHWNIVLSDYGKPFFEDSLLPLGGLREYRSAYRRADMIIFTKCPTSLRLYDRKYYSGRIADFPADRIIYSSLRHLEPVFLEPFEQTVLNHEGHYLLVTGIANTDILCDHLNNTGVIYKHLAYADHVEYSPAILREIQSAFEDLHSSCRAILTTEKDFVKLVSHAEFFVQNQMPLAYIPIEIDFQDRDRQQLQAHLNNFAEQCRKKY
jgi:tetraacyldisaccharide 4'-kinase